ncbi:hypothetical protein IAT38_007027 [Cryptococcus sp. DSM 104549]
MADPPTPLSVPRSLPYPITIRRLVAKPGDAVKRGTLLLEYSFMSSEQREQVKKRKATGKAADKSKGESDQDDMIGTWESLVDGELVQWKDVKVGTVLDKRSADRPLVTIQQACSHPVQLHGMCGVCGADLTEDDYLSAPAASSSSRGGPSRYPGGFEIAHDAMGVTVSQNEAERLENLSRDSLLDSRRLSLIVDLDQTIIHTTVDPTVAEWMDEIESDEQSDSSTDSASLSGQSPRKAEGAEGNNADQSSTTPPGSPRKGDAPKRPRAHKEKNPNAEALKDVAKFQISDDLPPGYVKRSRGENPGRWYFTKPRPGLQKFLDNMSKLYEMHVYTMGTRTYADAICKVIDPDGTTFGGRILSRDESGSFSSKNLKRLFPTDTSMVVVIDDRSDVWGDCPNLVKVVPYDFFIGIGDINSSFLPTNKSTPAPSTSASPTLHSPASTSDALSSDASTPPPQTPDAPFIEGEPAADDELLLKTKLLDEVSTARPLAKLQEELENKEDAGEQQAEAISEAETKENAAKPASAGPGSSAAVVSESPSRHRKPLLNPNDFELHRVADILGEIHRRFYNAYDGIVGWDRSKALPMNCDVEFIIPELKGEVLEGCNIVFSGLIPRDADPTTTDIWQAAETFGGTVTANLTPKTTHLVTATLNTEKTHNAGKNKKIKIVWATWFWDSVALWRRQPEVKYLAAKSNEGILGRKMVGTGVETPTTAKEAAARSTMSADVDMDAELEGFGDGRGPAGADESMDVDRDRKGGPDEEDTEKWDDELYDFLNGKEDYEPGEGDSTRGSGSVPGSPKTVSTPGTPSKKRVRYADEESLPLEDFKDPSPPDPSDKPPQKRRKPLLLEAPSEDDEIPEANQFHYRKRGNYGKSGGHGEEAASEAGDEGELDEQSADEEEHAEEEDEFAKMLAESLEAVESGEDAEES